MLQSVAGFPWTCPNFLAIHQIYKDCKFCWVQPGFHQIHPNVVGLCTRSLRPECKWTLRKLHRIIGKQPKLAKATRTFAKRGRSLNHCELTRTSCHFTALTEASQRSMGLFDSDHQIYRNHTNFSRGRKSALNSTQMLNTSQISFVTKTLQA